MDDKISFTATVEKVPTEGGWHIIRLSKDVLQALRAAADKNGNVPIMATIGKTTWPTTIMSSGQQQWFFAVNAKVRKAENVTKSDNVSVIIKPDETRLKKV